MGETYSKPISITTFNVLAPIFKRVGAGRRESEDRAAYVARHSAILEHLKVCMMMDVFSGPIASFRCLVDVAVIWCYLLLIAR